MKTELEVIVLEELRALGLDLVELRIGGSRRRPVLDVRMDTLTGAKVTVDDCARASRALQARLDAGEVALNDYVLEVSSPGVERPLRKPADWRRFTGRTVSVASPLLGGRREFELVGVDGEDAVAVAVLQDKKGVETRVPLADVTEARLVFHWKR